MRERKDMGEIYTGEVLPPTPTGKKAVVMMDVQIMVEVNETEVWNDMVSQAKEELRKRIYASKGFFPFGSRCSTIHPDVEVEELKYHTIVDGKGKW